MRALPKILTRAGVVVTFMAVIIVMSQATPMFAQEVVPGLLHITSPPGGRVVHPGQTIAVNVAAAAGARFRMVCAHGINLAGAPIRGGCLGKPPYLFAVAIPKVIPAGKYPLIVSGLLGPGRVGRAESITLDVEPAAPITKLHVDVHRIDFTEAGEHLPIAVDASFADGTGMNINHSTRIKFIGGNPDLFTVSKDGWVTCAKNPYATVATIKVQYEDKWAIVIVSTIHVPGARPAPATPGPPRQKPRPGQPNHKPFLENGPQ